MRALCICLLFLGPALGTAQDAKDFRKVTCRFLALDSNAPPPPLLNMAEKGVEIPCTVYTNSLSPETACFAKGNALSFISKDDRKPAATATILPNSNAFILVFVKAAKAPEALPWRVFVIEDNPKNFPDGGAFVANFHSKDIRFVIGDSKIMLRPAGSHGFAMPAKRNSFNMAPVVFEFLQMDEYQQKDMWKTASESMLRFLPGMRYLIFAYVDPVSLRPRIATFQDLGGAKSQPVR